MTDEHDLAQEDAIRTVLRDAMPGRSIATLEPAGTSWNTQNATAHVTFADSEAVYCKVALDGTGSRVATERATIEFVAGHGAVPVPTVLASDPDGDPPYVVTAPLSGQNLAVGWDERPLAERERIAAEFGAALASLHELTFDVHGHVVGGGAGGLELDRGPWTEALLDSVAETRARASTDRFAHHFDAVEQALAKNRSLLDAAPAALVFGDPAQPNLVRRGDEIGFIDWEIAHVGDPARELVRASHQFVWRDEDVVVDALESGYEREAGGLPVGLGERRPLYDIVWHLEVGAVFDSRLERADDPATLVEDHEAKFEQLLTAVT